MDLAAAALCQPEVAVSVVATLAASRHLSGEAVAFPLSPAIGMVATISRCRPAQW